MSEWFETLDGIRGRVWQTLGRGVADRRSAARHPTFATVSPDGWPEARTVVLRAADAQVQTLDVHTDFQSDKVKSLRGKSRAAFHIWDEKQKLQLRLGAEVEILSGDVVADLWAKVPDPSRQAYGTDPAPGTAINDALAYTKPADPAAFAVLRCKVIAIDVVHLGADHRRALFTRDSEWIGEWLAP